MVWGCIGLDYKSELVFIDQNIDSKSYIDIVPGSSFITFAITKNHKYGWFFQQDGVPAHHSKETYHGLKSKLNVLPGWPPHSIDLNPIELLCGVIKKVLKKKKYHLL